MAAAQTADQFGDGRIGLTVGGNANVKTLVEVFQERSLDCLGDPVVSVTEDATTSSVASVTPWSPHMRQLLVSKSSLSTSL
ncbi:hypothetical protein [Bremerella alba]|uniref:hypothetical protein n=1 Tax=Bremerella alba TaxID=980252 RepID=UPI001A955E53|nr:hypothetical protein [Bremerella alba]